MIHRILRLVLVLFAMLAVGARLLANAETPSGTTEEDAPAAKPGDGGVRRDLRVRVMDLAEDGRLRAFVSAAETDSGVFYPMTTLDRSAFRLFTHIDGEVPARAASLWSFSSLTPAARRAMVVAWQESDDVPTRVAAEVRKAIAELLPAARADYLAAIAAGGGEVRELANVTPARSENIKAVQRSVLDSVPLGPDQGPTALLCAAADRFTEWGQDTFAPGDQKVLIGVFGIGDPQIVDPARTQSCWQRLHDEGVSVWFVTWSPEADGVPAPRFVPDLARGGFAHAVRSPLDVFPALSNIMSILNDEYVIDFLLPPYHSATSEVETVVEASYHGNVLRSAAVKVPLPEGAVRQESGLAPGDAHWATRFHVSPARVALGAAIVLVVLSLWLVIRMRLKHSQKFVVCKTCLAEVARDFSDCPFRESECVGRLVVVGGRNSGVSYPVFSGENTLGASSSCSIRLPRGRGIAAQHATLLVKDRKALYDTSAGVGRDRVNGWPCHEPRLVGTGSSIRIGTCHLRFEARTES